MRNLGLYRAELCSPRGRGTNLAVYACRQAVWQRVPIRNRIVDFFSLSKAEIVLPGNC